MKKVLIFSIFVLATLTKMFSQEDFQWNNLPYWVNILEMEPIQEENIYLSPETDKHMTAFGEAIENNNFSKANSLRGLIFKQSVSLATFTGSKGKIWVLLKDNSPMAVQVKGGIITFHRLEMSLDSPKYQYKKPSYFWKKESKKLQNIGPKNSLFNLYFLEKGALRGGDIIFYQSDEWKMRNIRTAQLLVRYHIKGDKKKCTGFVPFMDRKDKGIHVTSTKNETTFELKIEKVLFEITLFHPGGDWSKKLQMNAKLSKEDKTWTKKVYPWYQRRIYEYLVFGDINVLNIDYFQPDDH